MKPKQTIGMVSDMILKMSLFAVLLLPLCGCGSHLPELVPVRGQVQFDGGTPPTAGIVNFLPIEGSSPLPARPGSGNFGSDGKFEATSFSGAKGLVPGRYRVQIECFSRQPKPIPGDYEKANYVPANYKPPELVVDPGQRGIHDLIYNVPKKQ